MSTYGVANLAPRRKLAHELHLSRAETLSEAPVRVEKVEPSLPYPEPEIRARAADLSVVRGSVKSFIALLEAQEEKFAYDVREARGWIPDARTSEPKTLASSISIRVRSARGRLALVWVEGRIDTALAYMPKRGLFPITVTQAKDFVRGASLLYIPKKKAESRPSKAKEKDGMR